MPKSNPLPTDPRARHGLVSALLRSRGFVPLPRLWVKPKDMPEIHRITRQYCQEVNAARAEVAGEKDPVHQAQRATTREAARRGREAASRNDPRSDKNAAWEIVEQLRKMG